MGPFLCLVQMHKVAGDGGRKGKKVKKERMEGRKKNEGWKGEKEMREGRREGKKEGNKGTAHKDLLRLNKQKSLEV